MTGRKFLSAAEFVLGIFLFLDSLMYIIRTFSMRRSPEFYAVGFRLWNVDMLVAAGLAILGIFLVCHSRKTVLFQRLYRTFQSVAAKRDMVSVAELCEEGHCSKRKGLEYLEKMLDKNLFQGAKLDWQKGMVLLTEEAAKEYQQVWESWTEKQKKYRGAGIPLKEQEIFLLGAVQAEELGKLAEQIQQPEIHRRLGEIASFYEKRYSHMEKEKPNTEFLTAVAKEYFPQVKDMAEDYIQMETLDSTVGESLSAQRFRDFLYRFPGMGK